MPVAPDEVHGTRREASRLSRAGWNWRPAARLRYTLTFEEEARLTGVMEWVTQTDEETRAIGEALGRGLGPGDVVCLEGPLGAGKTTLAQGIARGLDVDDVVNSPTFTLVQEYVGRHPVYHLDVYRLSGPEEAADLAIPEMIAAGGVLLIEWPERVAPLLPDDRLEIRLQPEGDTRRLTAVAHGPRARAVVAGSQE